jgi:tRNA(Met) cytidine acetyltransferase
MVPVRIGFKREASSGSHALMLMQPLSPGAQRLFSALRTRFCQQLPVLLSEPLQQLEAELALPLLHDCRTCQPTELEAQDWRDIHSFAHGKRGYEVCMAALRKLVPGRDLSTLSPPQQALLLHKIIQQQGWQACIRQLEMQGHQQAESALREAIGKLIQCDEVHGRQPTTGPQ